MDEFPVATSPAPGVMGVDWEMRVDFERLRRVPPRPRASDARRVRPRRRAAVRDVEHPLRHRDPDRLLGVQQGRAVGARHPGGPAEDLGLRLGGEGPPPAASRTCTTRRTRSAGNTGLQGAIGPETGLHARAVREIKAPSTRPGVANDKLGVDLAETAVFLALQAAGLAVVDGQQAMMRAREIKSLDEIVLLTQACAMVDGVYQDIFEMLKPGCPRVRRGGARPRAPVRDGLGVRRGHQLDRRRTVQPAPARVQRPPHPAGRPGLLRHHPRLQRLPDLLLPDVRRRPGDPGPARRLQAARGSGWTPPSTSSGPARRPTRSPRSGRRPRSSGSTTRWTPSGCSSATASGVGLHERPIISRLNSLETPVEIQEGMLFALETYAPAADGRSAARIEEEVVVTADGCKVITLFPCEELMVANAY